MVGRFIIGSLAAAWLLMSGEAAQAVSGASPPQEAASASAPERMLVVRSGDTLAGLLGGAGVDSGDVHRLVVALQDLFPPRALRPGQEIAITLDPSRDDALAEFEIEPSPGRTIRATLQGEQWQVEEILAPKQRMLVRVAGKVEGGLFPAMTASGMPPGLALSLIRALGHEIDFQRDLQPGDSFAVLFERFRDDEGALLGHGRVLHAELMLSGRRLAIWRHTTRDGTADWYDAAGRSLRRAFLRTPLDGARVSSGFGMRSHPILGFTRLHRGTDFAAPTGTPVYAAAHGTVIAARYERGYGRIVRLRHASGVETRYAHLSRFARGIAPGRQVRQGDAIGAVGSTGLSTGPHLHYEVIVQGRPVDPARRTAQSVQLAGRELTAYRTAQRSLSHYAAALSDLTEIAMAE
jgi:murein DD-endopeptidase MepM/ murein hydrolase activator NlpD